MIKFFFGTLGVAWLILKDCHSVCQRILKGKIHSSYFCLGKYIPPVDFYISFFFLPLFLFLTLTESLEGVYIPTKSNCQSNFVNSCKNYSCNFFVSLIQMETAKNKTISQPAITCSNLVTETLEQRCEICS